MKLQILSKRIVITPLDRKCLEALEAGEARPALLACSADLTAENALHLENVISERHLDLDFADEDIRWNTLWVGVNRETRAIVGTIRMFGHPTAAHELTIAAYLFRYPVMFSFFLMGISARRLAISSSLTLSSMRYSGILIEMMSPSLT